MTTPSITVTLAPAIEALANILTRTSESYHQLLTQPESHSLCREAGRSVRYLSDRYTQVLLAALSYTPESESADVYENWDDEGDTPSEEELDE